MDINASIVMLFAIIRFLVVKSDETPKFLVANGREDQAVENLHILAKKYGRRCELTLDQLEDCGQCLHPFDARQKMTFKKQLMS